MVFPPSASLCPDSMMYTEMVNATGLHYVKELPKIMEVDPTKDRLASSCLTDFLAQAAQMAVEEGADTVDINMGCQIKLLKWWIFFAA